MSEEEFKQEYNKLLNDYNKLAEYHNSFRKKYYGEVPIETFHDSYVNNYSTILKNDFTDFENYQRRWIERLGWVLEKYYEDDCDYTTISRASIVLTVFKVATEIQSYARSVMTSVPSFTEMWNKAEYEKLLNNIITDLKGLYEIAQKE